MLRHVSHVSTTVTPDPKHYSRRTAYIAACTGILIPHFYFRLQSCVTHKANDGVVDDIIQSVVLSQENA